MLDIFKLCENLRVLCVKYFLNTENTEFFTEFTEKRRFLIYL